MHNNVYCIVAHNADIFEYTILGVFETELLAQQHLKNITESSNISISRTQFEDLYEEMLRNSEYDEFYGEDIDFIIKLHPELNKNDLIKADELYNNSDEIHYEILTIPYYGINS